MANTSYVDTLNASTITSNSITGVAINVGANGFGATTTNVEMTDAIDMNNYEILGANKITATTVLWLYGNANTIQMTSDSNQVVDIFGDCDIKDDCDITDDLSIGGTANANVKAFKIDHPLDPENKFLYHTSIESPEMGNVYYGQVETKNGKAIVKMPEWFHALNGIDKYEFNYQLTSIGKKAICWISKELENFEFEISSDVDCKVSWQVSAIRHDKFAEENRIQVETYKNKEIVENCPEKAYISDKMEWDSDLQCAYKTKRKTEFLKKKPTLLEIKDIEEQLDKELDNQTKEELKLQLKEKKETLTKLKGSNINLKRVKIY